MPKASNNTSSRRRLLKSTLAAGALTIVPRHVLGQNQTPPSAKPNLAGVGVGGVGFGQLQECAQAGFNIVALCDVDHSYAKKAFDHWPKARRYKDFREMLQAESDRIDAVYCGTPDHTHALICLAAIRHKKHVCCVKPLTRTIAECRTLVDAARKARLATQVTAAANTSESACRTCERIAAGAIGPVREVHIWSDRPVWPQGMSRPAGSDPIPADLDWKLWIGPAPMRPFKSRWADSDPALQQINYPGKPWYTSVYHPFNFRGWWDFGTGALGDMGCHFFNTPFRALNLTYPTHIHATSTKLLPESAPLASIVTYDFPARGQMPALRMVWYDGGLKPPTPPELQDRSLPGDGVLYIGDEGKMLGPNILNPKRARQFDSLPKTLQRRGGTWTEWLEACQGGQPAGCHFDWADYLTHAVLLGNIAIRTQKPLTYDPDRRRFTNNPDANAFIDEPYHNGWSLKSL